MWKQLQIGTLILFVLFAVLTVFCQVRCGMLGGQIARGEASPEALEQMQAQAKKAAFGALARLLACMLCGALGMQ